VTLIPPGPNRILPGMRAWAKLLYNYLLARRWSSIYESYCERPRGMQGFALVDQRVGHGRAPQSGSAELVVDLEAT